MSKYFPIILIGIVGYFVGTSVFSKDEWIGFFYPDKNDLLEYRQSQGFTSLDDCRVWAQDQALMGGMTISDYECGRNCRSNGSGPLICEVTTR
jgi:hypothetical protein